MATATFDLDGMAKAVTKIKSTGVLLTMGNVSDKPLAFTANTTRLETTNKNADGNALYTIVSGGSSLNNQVRIHHYGSGNEIGYFTIQGGNVGTNDFIYHIRQITLTFI